MKAVLLIVAFVCFGSVPSKCLANDEGKPETRRANLDLVRQLNEAFVQVAETASPSVVVLTVAEKPPTFTIPGDKDTPEQREYWRRFHEHFGEPEQGRGSGIIIRTNGFILTNRHVVQDAEKIQVRLFDGRTFVATVQGTDEFSDVAVIKIDADDLPVARLGDSSKVRVGEFAIAIGAPFRLDYSVTVGHISAKSRADVIPMHLGGMTMDQDFLQTDANINPGNSGGPLLNIEGEVIGVNTLIRGGLRTAIGFAIPINLALEVSEQLIANGRFARPWLGVEIRAVSDDPDLRNATNGVSQGVVVTGVMPGSPAADSTLRERDIIVAVDKAAVSSTQQLRAEVRRKGVGESVTLDVVRGKERLQIAIKTGEFRAPRSIFSEESEDPAQPSDP